MRPVLLLPPVLLSSSSLSFLTFFFFFLRFALRDSYFFNKKAKPKGCGDPVAVKRRYPKLVLSRATLWSLGPNSSHADLYGYVWGLKISAVPCLHTTCLFDFLFCVPGGKAQGHSKLDRMHQAVNISNH